MRGAVTLIVYSDPVDALHKVVKNDNIIIPYSYYNTLISICQAFKRKNYSSSQDEKAKPHEWGGARSALR